MKLNLLPQAVTKRSAAPLFIAMAAVMVLVATAGAAWMVVDSKDQLKKAIAERESHLPGYANNLATANDAERVIQQAVNYDRNVKLVQECAKHNNVYADLYNKLLPYIPSFYRIHSLNATGGGDTCSVTMVGHLSTFQQYADLELVLWRIPEVISVQRAGYVPRHSSVQGLTPDRQKSVEIKPGETPLPDDPLQQIEVLKARAASVPTGFVNAGGFGTDASPKLDMPDYQTVTMTVLMKGNLQVPDPAATLAAAAAAPAAAPVAAAAPAAKPAADDDNGTRGGRGPRG